MTRRLILFVGLAGALLLAACGGSATAETDGVASLDETTTTGNPGDNPGSDNDDPESVEAAYMAFTECMRGEGVDMPDPIVNADGSMGIRIGEPGNHEDIDMEAIAAASENCGHLLEGFTRETASTDMSAVQDTILEFAACMRDHGIDFPDPDFSGGGVTFGGQAGGGPGSSLDLDDPQVQEAMDICSEILDEAGVVRNVGPGS